jgi:hypothetical protein
LYAGTSRISINGRRARNNRTREEAEAYRQAKAAKDRALRERCSGKAEPTQA